MLMPDKSASALWIPNPESVQPLSFGFLWLKYTWNLKGAQQTCMCRTTTETHINQSHVALSFGSK